MDGITDFSSFSIVFGGGRVVRWCWVNFQCQGVLLTWIIVGQGPTVLAVGAGGDCLDIFSLLYHFSFLSISLWVTARYRLKYCLKGPFSPKQPTNQPNQQYSSSVISRRWANEDERLYAIESRLRREVFASSGARTRDCYIIKPALAQTRDP